MRLAQLICITASVATVATSSYAQPADLDRVLPPERQRQLGLDKLTADQRAGVAQALIDAYRLGVQSAQDKPSARQSSPGGTAVIESQISGDFNGWEGQTVVKLMNGQIWQQTEYHYHYHYAFMPKVLIYPSGGIYKMKVDGIEKAISVERIK